MVDNNTWFVDYRLEKEYTTIKNKEMEEQIEIKVRERIKNGKTLENVTWFAEVCIFCYSNSDYAPRTDS